MNEVEDARPQFGAAEGVVVGAGTSRAAVKSGLWTASQQGLALTATAGMNILLARSLGVVHFGLYAYGVALASIGISVMSAGLSGLAVKALVRDRDTNGATLAALIVIREAFALGGYVLILAISLVAGTPTQLAVTLLAGAALFGRALEAPDMWYTSVFKGGVVARVRFGVTFLTFAARVAALIWFANLWVFLALYAVEALLSGAAVFVRYLLDKRAPGLALPNGSTFRELLGASWPLMLSGVANQLNLRADLVVIQVMLTPAAVGMYAVAAQVSQVSYFIPMVFMNATLPLLVQARESKGSRGEYDRLLQNSYTRWFWAGVVIAVVLGGTAHWTVPVVFGSEYAAAAPILAVHVAACPFVFMGAVYSKWIIIENLLWSSVARHGLGAVINIILNIALIPSMGIMGSAVATLVSYIVASYLSCFVGRRTRQAAVQMTRAIGAPVLLLSRRGRDRWQ